MIYYEFYCAPYGGVWQLVEAVEHASDGLAGAKIISGNTEARLPSVPCAVVGVGAVCRSASCDALQGTVVNLLFVDTKSDNYINCLSIAICEAICWGGKTLIGNIE